MCLDLNQEKDQEKKEKNTQREERPATFLKNLLVHQSLLELIQNFPPPVLNREQRGLLQI